MGAAQVESFADIDLSLGQKATARLLLWERWPPGCSALGGLRLIILLGRNIRLLGLCIAYHALPTYAKAQRRTFLLHLLDNLCLLELLLSFLRSFVHLCDHLVHLDLRNFESFFEPIEDGPSACLALVLTLV